MFRVNDVGDYLGFDRVNTAAGVALPDWIEPQFLKRRNGLFLRGSPEVSHAVGVVFPSAQLLQRVAAESPAGTLIFSHHPTDDDFLDRGVLPMDLEAIGRVRASHQSIYYLHHPLDVGLPFSTSSALADALDIRDTVPFLPYDGGALGMIGRTEILEREPFVSKIKKILGIERVQTLWRHPDINPVAVVAGGADSAEFLEAAAASGCRTFLNGIVHNHVSHPDVRRDNEAFVGAANTLGLNVVGVSHYASEEPVIRKMLGVLAQRFEIETTFLPDLHKIGLINQYW